MSDVGDDDCGEAKNRGIMLREGKQLWAEKPRNTRPKRIREA